MSSDPDPLAALGQVDDGSFRRLTARLALLRAYARHRDEEGLSDAQAQDEIAEAYENGAADVPDWTYDVYDSVTARTLRRWASQFRDDGLPGLIDRHGRRSERSYDSYFGAGSELRKIALYYIADHPDCTSTELRDELAQHVDEDDLPTLRTVQRFLSKMG